MGSSLGSISSTYVGESFVSSSLSIVTILAFSSIVNLLKCRCRGDLLTGFGTWGSFLVFGIQGDLGSSAACGMASCGLSVVEFFFFEDCFTVMFWQCLKPWSFFKFLVTHLVLILDTRRLSCRMVKHGGVNLTMIIYDFKFKIGYSPLWKLINVILAVIFLP